MDIINSLQALRIELENEKNSEEQQKIIKKIDELVALLTLYVE